MSAVTEDPFGFIPYSNIITPGMLNLKEKDCRNELIALHYKTEEFYGMKIKNLNNEHSHTKRIIENTENSSLEIVFKNENEKVKDSRIFPSLIFTEIDKGILVEGVIARLNKWEDYTFLDYDPYYEPNPNGHIRSTITELTSIIQVYQSKFRMPKGKGIEPPEDQKQSFKVQDKEMYFVHPKSLLFASEITEHILLKKALTKSNPDSEIMN